MEQYTYKTEEYYARRTCTEKEQMLKRRGKPLDPEQTLYLHVLRVLPDAPCCVVQLLHGMCEHIERYLSFAEYLASHGIAVVMHDLRGYGKSILPGYFSGHCGAQALELLHSDIDVVYASFFCPVPENGHMDVSLDALPTVDPLPRFLLGFSMGALAAGHYMAENDARLSGVMLAGLPHRETFAPLALAGIRFLNLFHEDYFRPLWLGLYSISRYNRYFPDEEGELCWLSEDSEDQQGLELECGFGVSQAISMYRFLLMLVRETYRPADWEVQRRDLPIWLFSGEEDPIAGGRKWTLDSEHFLTDIGYRHVDNRLFPHHRHEIFHDKTRLPVWQETVETFLRVVESETKRLDALRDTENAAYTPVFPA